MAFISSSRGIFSAWLRIDDIAETRRLVFYELSTGGPSYVRFSVYFDDTFQKYIIDGTSLGTGAQFQLETVSTIPAATSSELHHFLASWDMSGGSFQGSIYLDDIADFNINFGTDSGTEIEWQLIDSLNVFAIPPFTGNFWDGCCAQIYLNTEEYLDFSVTLNRRKFIDALGGMVSLGINGELPTGNSPSIYHYGKPSNFPINYGTQGQMTNLVGILSNCPGIIPPGCCTWFFSDKFISF